MERLPGGRSPAQPPLTTPRRSSAVVHSYTQLLPSFPLLLLVAPIPPLFFQAVSIVSTHPSYSNRFHSSPSCCTIAQQQHKIGHFRPNLPPGCTGLTPLLPPCKPPRPIHRTHSEPCPTNFVMSAPCSSVAVVTYPARLIVSFNQLQGDQKYRTGPSNLQFNVTFSI